MQSLLTKLIILLIAVIGYVVYSKMDQIKAMLGEAEQAMPEIAIPSVAEPEKPATTTVYKWQDASGEWHITSTPPPKGATVEAKTYAHDANVVPAVKAKKPESETSLFSTSSGISSSAGSAGLKALATEDGQNLGNLKRGLQQLQDVNREEDLDSKLDRIR